MIQKVNLHPQIANSNSISRRLSPVVESSDLISESFTPKLKCSEYVSKILSETKCSDYFTVSCQVI